MRNNKKNKIRRINPNPIPDQKENEETDLNVEVDSDGVMRLPENLLYRLMYAEEQIKVAKANFNLAKKDLGVVDLSEQKCRTDLAMLAVRRAELGRQIVVFGEKIKEKQQQHQIEIQLVQDETGLDLKKCVIGDSPKDLGVIRFDEDLKNKEG